MDIIIYFCVKILDKLDLEQTKLFRIWIDGVLWCKIIIFQKNYIKW
jgi:hypothetical protein